MFSKEKEQSQNNVTKKVNKHVFFFPITFRLSLYFFHSLPFQRPLTLTPTARSGCGLYSLVKIIKQNIKVREAQNHNRTARTTPSHLSSLVEHNFWHLWL